MENLSINTILNQEEDSELTTYKILGTLKVYLSSIRKYKIYPALSELVGIAVRLESLKKSIAKAKNSDDDLIILSEEISMFGDLHPEEEYSKEADDISDFINWVISQINPILEEGIAVYDFVDQNMDLKLIKGDSFNKQEGYLIIPDNKTLVFNIYRFDCLLFNSESNPERSIKTEFIQSITGNDANKNRIQYITLLDYIANNTLPVYICETELDFPYEETVYQIGRKKLLNSLSS
jgi:hypothetical protein